MYLDYKLVATSTGTSLTYTLSNKYQGEHTLNVIASASGFRDSEFSEGVVINTMDEGNYLTTNSGEFILTNSGDKIEINE